MKLEDRSCFKTEDIKVKDIDIEELIKSLGKRKIFMSKDFSEKIISNNNAVAIYKLGEKTSRTPITGYRLLIVEPGLLTAEISDYAHSYQTTSRRGIIGVPVTAYTYGIDTHLLYEGPEKGSSMLVAAKTAINEHLNAMIEELDKNPKFREASFKRHLERLRDS